MASRDKEKTRGKIQGGSHLFLDWGYRMTMYRERAKIKTHMIDTMIVHMVSMNQALQKYRS